MHTTEHMAWGTDVNHLIKMKLVCPYQATRHFEDALNDIDLVETVNNFRTIPERGDICTGFVVLLIYLEIVGCEDI